MMMMMMMKKEILGCEISGFRREVAENRAFLGYYTACRGNSLPTFRDSVSVPSSRILDPVITQKSAFLEILRFNIR